MVEMLNAIGSDERGWSHDCAPSEQGSSDPVSLSSLRILAANALRRPLHHLLLLMHTLRMRQLCLILSEPTR